MQNYLRIIELVIIVKFMQKKIQNQESKLSFVLYHTYHCILNNRMNTNFIESLVI